MTGNGISRREWMHCAGLAAAGLPFLGVPRGSQEGAGVPVALVQGGAAAAAIPKAIEALGKVPVADRDVYLKASFNSADPFPASTDPESLRAVIRALRDLRCRSITLVERSGMGRTAAVWQEIGLQEILRGLDVRVLPLDDLEPPRWRRVTLPDSHWQHGVEAPWFLDGDACLVQLSNLKTHRFGGHFSGSLKNTIGLIAKRGEYQGRPYNYMRELHTSPHQRLMIAEVNQICKPVLVVMDATQVFVSGGPERGLMARPEAILASPDPVAVDAAGIGLLRIHGAVGSLARTGAFKQDQISRAIELGLGVKSPKEIQLLAADDASRRLMYQLNASLMENEEPKLK